MSLMIFQWLQKEEILQRIKKQIPGQCLCLAFRSEAAKHYSFKAFLIPNEGGWAARINEEVHRTSASGVFQVPGSRSPKNIFSVDFHLVACLQLSGAYLSCTTRVTDDLGE